MTAHVSFLEGTFSLIHIPLDVYPTFLQPVLQVLLPHDHGRARGGGGGDDDDDDGGGDEIKGLSIDSRHGFLNVSVTPVECSVVCHGSWADNVFAPAIRALPDHASSRVTISQDAYLILSVISASVDAGSRVMELTSPLALAGIPIFFITTYYSDFILVPTKDRQTVVEALLDGNFEFSDKEDTFVSPTSSTKDSHGLDRLSSASPPPSTTAELQVRTFKLLRDRNVLPYLQPDLDLALCSGRELSQFADTTGRQSSHGAPSERRDWLDNMDPKLYTSLISVLVRQPRFLSITLAQEDPPSLLLDKSLLDVFGDSVVGDTDCSLVPIFLDLVDLPLEASGIVSGVAGKLVDEMRTTDADASSELSYLSTARAGAVILSDEQSAKAFEILQPLLARAD